MATHAKDELQGLRGVRQAQLSVPQLALYVEPAAEFAAHCATAHGMASDRRKDLAEAVRRALSYALEKALEGPDHDAIQIVTKGSDGVFAVEIINRGVPIFAPGAGNVGAGVLGEIAKNIDRVAVENCGRGGQKIVLEMRLPGEHLSGALAPSGSPRAIESVNEPILRPLAPGEEVELAQLFYHVYGYNYVNEFVYYPERIRELIDTDRLISFVGVIPDGPMVGHVGLLRWNDNPASWEACLGVTHPGLKSKGMFGSLFRMTMEHMWSTPMQFCFFDCVTNHDFSQRLIFREGANDTAIFVGSQNKAYQAKLSRLGLGKDPEDMDRYTILFTLIPRVEQPFGSHIRLPLSIGEMLGFLLEPFNLQWIPTPRFEALPTDGAFSVKFQPAHQAAIFELEIPGSDPLEQIIAQWHELLRAGYAYAAVDVPIDLPGLGAVRERLSAEGFFIAGFLPLRYANRLCIRFQALGPAQVAWDRIKVFSEPGKLLLSLVREDYERNRRL